MSLKSLVAQRPDMKPMQENLELIAANADSIFTKFDGIVYMKSICEGAEETRRKINAAQSTLQDITKKVEMSTKALAKSSNCAKLQTLAQLDSFLSSMRLNIIWGTGEKEIQEKIHTNFTQIRCTFDAHYSGTVGYSGSQYYSGSQNYRHTITVTRSKCGTCNEYGPFPSHENNYTTCDYCGASARFCSHCGKKFGEPVGRSHGRWIIKDEPTKIWPSDQTKNFEGHVSYSGNVNYQGSTPYSG